tara:strand:+ start:1734 stop:2021 length:288 start_codon:yes stop_codon:yes gene_type:complete
MSRPKPTVLLEKVEKETYKAEQVLASDGIWAVYYDKKPINLKTFNMLISYPGPKYKKVSFSNPGHAINLCKKLNRQFQTDLFTVVILDKGKQIYP